MSKEIVCIPSYKREDMLRECLNKLRSMEPDIEVHLFSDKGHYSPELGELTWKYNVNLHVLPKHSSKGNNYLIWEVFTWLSLQQDVSVYLVEDDALIHAGFFSWVRQHVDSAFACCGWSAPIPGWNSQGQIQYFSGVAAGLSLTSIKKIAIQAHNRRPYDLQITDYLLRTQQFCLYPAKRLVDHIGQSGLNFKRKAGSNQDTGFADNEDWIPVPGLNENRKPVLKEGVWRLT